MEPTESKNVSYPNQMDNVGKSLASIASLLREAEELLPILRREFRGEAIVQYPDGTVEYIQISKPLFIRMDQKTQTPKMELRKYKDGTEKEVYMPNDEAIEEVLSMLKFMGLNNITKMTNISEQTVLEDLREWEMKLAAILMLKQKAWGIDKELLPIRMSQLKTIVQDARYMAVNGNTIKAIQKTVSRTESFFEGSKTSRGFSPYAT